LYPIAEKLLKNNRSYRRLAPQGIVVHSTATPGATAENEYQYFNRAYRGASAHYFVDWQQIIRTIPEDEVAWHAGKTANALYLSVEMCEPRGHRPAQFEEVWRRTVWLVADACVRYGWCVHRHVFSHRQISLLYRETTHVDPHGYLERYGRTWEDLLAAICRQIEELAGEDKAKGQEGATG